MSGAAPDPIRPGETPAACVQRFVDAAERRITPCGDGDLVWHIFGNGPPLVLLHGGFGRWSHWIRNIPVLARHFTLYLPDIPGHGDSAVPPDPYTGLSIAALIKDGLEILVPEGPPIAAAGFSFGGIIGGCLAAQNPRIETLAVCGSNGLGLNRGPISGLRHWRGVTDPDELAAVHRNNLEIVMFGDPGRVDDLAVYLQTTNAPDARIKGRLIAVTDALAAALPAVEGRIVPIFGALDCYAKDFMEERIALFRSIQPENEFRIIDDAGHWVMYEQPDRFNAVLLEVLGIKDDAHG